MNTKTSLKNLWKSSESMQSEMSTVQIKKLYERGLRTKRKNEENFKLNFRIKSKMIVISEKEQVREEAKNSPS